MQITLPAHIFSFDEQRSLTGLSAPQYNAALWSRPARLRPLLERMCERELGWREKLAPEEVVPKLESHFDWIEDRSGLSQWIEDVQQLVARFCELLGESRCGVHLEDQRACQRFHADNLKYRLVCCYRGPGTLWLPNDNVHLHQAETRGTSNQDMVVDPTRIQQLSEWEVLVMKGRKSSTFPLYHKSPTPQPGEPRSLLLKLDEPGF